MKVIALTGPPAAGKSTITGIMRDIGVPVKDTGEAVRDEAAERYDDPSEDDIWDVATSLRDEHGPAGPTIACKDWIDEQQGEPVICISGLRDQAEVEWLRENSGPTLVINVTAQQGDRCTRYVESKIDADSVHEAVSSKRVMEFIDEFHEREERERPYPDHDLEFMNENDVDVKEIYDRMENVVRVMSA